MLKKAFLSIVWWFIYYLLVGVTCDVIVEAFSLPISEDTIVGFAFLTAIILTYLKMKKKHPNSVTPAQVPRTHNFADNMNEQIDQTSSTPIETNPENTNSHSEKNAAQKENPKKSPKKRKKITKDKIIEELIKERSSKQR